MKSMRDNLKKSANIETPRREEEGSGYPWSWNAKNLITNKKVREIQWPYYHLYPNNRFTLYANPSQSLIVHHFLTYFKSIFIFRQFSIRP